MRTRRFQLARFVALFVLLLGCAPLLIGQTAPEGGAKRTEPSNSVSGPGQHNRMRSTGTTGMIRVPETWNRWGFLARCPSLRRKARF